MVKIVVASILVISGLAIMRIARGPATLFGFVLMVVGILSGVALYYTPKL